MSDDDRVPQLFFGPAIENHGFCTMLGNEGQSFSVLSSLPSGGPFEFKLNLLTKLGTRENLNYRATRCISYLNLQDTLADLEPRC